MSKAFGKLGKSKKASIVVIKNVPGPAAYNLSSYGKCKIATKIMPKGGRPQYDNCNPGPGKYGVPRS